MVRARHGRSQVGCLMVALVMAALLYFAFNVGTVFWDNFRFVDRMKQEVRFAGSRSDAVIKRRMVAFADSLGLPEAARVVHIKRGKKSIVVWAEYYQVVEFPGFVKEVRFQPQATGAF